MSVGEEVPVWQVLNEVEVGAEESAEEQSQVLDKLLIFRVAGAVCRLQIQGEWDDLRYGCEDLCEHVDLLLIVCAVALGLQSSNLSQALQCNVAEFWCLQEACAKGIDNGGLENIAQWNPTEEAEKSLQGSVDQTWLGGGGEDLVTELENGGELSAHRGLKRLRLCGSHGICGKVEDLLGQES